MQTLKHYLMLRYFHFMTAHPSLSYLADHYRVPEVGYTSKGFFDRTFDPIDLKTIEMAYKDLRAIIKSL
jgi:hypothetical protein